MSFTRRGIVMISNVLSPPANVLLPETVRFSNHLLSQAPSHESGSGGSIGLMLSKGCCTTLNMRALGLASPGGFCGPFGFCGDLPGVLPLDGFRPPRPPLFPEPC
eukprot:3361981-Amphidinium_carterae.1